MMSRVLILSPHPDDEVVGCAATIRRAVTGGRRIFVLHLTTGIPPVDALWPWQRPAYAARVARRRAEAARAAARLDLMPLGFLDWPARTLKDHLDEALNLVRQTVAEHRIDELWVPAWEGAHQDHDVTNVIGSRLGDCCRVLEFAEYNLTGGKVQANSFPSATGAERTLPLSPQDRRWKRGMLGVYRSERGNLTHCGVTQETLRPLPAYDYALPPHPGRLFRERFHWVPFTHPRIDIEPSAAVREQLSAWLGQIATPHLMTTSAPRDAAA